MPPATLFDPSGRGTREEILSDTGYRGYYVVTDVGNRAGVKRLACSAGSRFSPADIPGRKTPQSVDAIAAPTRWLITAGRGVRSDNRAQRPTSLLLPGRCVA